MNVRFLGVIAAGALVLSGCGSDNPAPTNDDGGGTVTTQPTTQPTAQPPADNDAQAGAVDCSSLTSEDAATFIMYGQLLGQIRSVSDLQSMAITGYTPEAMGAVLDKLEGLKGVEGEATGTPDEALVAFRTANDTFAAIIAKGAGATDADFAPVTELWPSNDAWITDQAAISGAINAACPDL